MKSIIKKRYRQLHHETEAGQILVTLLVFMIIITTITAGSVAVIIANTQTVNKFTQGTRAYYVAEGGAENAILRFLRNPTYTGETVTIDDGTAVITVTGSGPYTITSVGTIGNFQRTIQITLGYTNNILSVTAWKEI